MVSMITEQYNTFSDKSSKFQYDGFKHDFFNVNIPWTLKRYEINTNWREISDFTPNEDQNKRNFSFLPFNEFYIEKKILDDNTKDL